MTGGSPGSVSVAGESADTRGWPHDPGLYRGRVWHRRTSPVQHQFDYDVAYVWVDPDRFDQLADRHWGWSTSRFRPVQLRRSDYGREPEGSLGQEVRNDLGPVLGDGNIGAIRMLTQVRRWGWLFNPITLYFAWSADDLTQAPVGVVLEVTNTPWRERHRYPLVLVAESSDADPKPMLRTEFDKSLHVSPFLGQDYRYDLTVRHTTPDLTVTIDVFGPGDDPVLATGMALRHEAATRSSLGRSIRQDRMSTIKVSAGIHSQAARLWRKGVPFVSHPKRKVQNGRS